MDHSAHSVVDHSGMDHGDMGHDDMCSMDMIFTWNWKNLCVIFKWWHVRSFTSFIFTLIAIVLLGIGYEYLRAEVSKLETNITSISLPNDSDNFEQLTDHQKIGSISRIKRAVYYAGLVGYSYTLMLVFMTYNGWAMLSVVIGAGLGNYLFNTKFNESLACH